MDSDYDFDGLISHILFQEVFGFWVIEGKGSGVYMAVEAWLSWRLRLCTAIIVRPFSILVRRTLRATFQCFQCLFCAYCIHGSH